MQTHSLQQHFPVNSLLLLEEEGRNISDIPTLSPSTILLNRLFVSAVALALALATEVSGPV